MHASLHRYQKCFDFIFFGQKLNQIFAHVIVAVAVAAVAFAVSGTTLELQFHFL